jgi:hypothetical protein
MIKKYFKPFFLFLMISFIVNACEDDFFGSDSLQGSWKVDESNDGTTFASQTYTAGIDYFQGDSTRISIDNFSNLGLGVEIIGNLNDKMINIPTQTIVDNLGNTFIVTGSGVISNNFRRINMNYSYDGDNFIAEFQKLF